MVRNAALSMTTVGETGTATDTEFGASSSAGGGEGSEEVACWPRSGPLAGGGGSTAGTASTEAARESLTYVLAGRTPSGPRETTGREHGQRILRMEHRGCQPSFGAHVGENPVNRVGRTGSPPEPELGSEGASPSKPTCTVEGPPRSRS